MDRSAIPLILRELKLNENDVVNIYNHGSWVYGSNSPDSDRDLLIVTRFPRQDPLQFMTDFDYFHEFELHKLWNQYDVCVYSVENFEMLLKKNFLMAVQCLFLPDEFKIKEEIDFREIYLNKYYDKIRLKQVAFYENFMDFNLCDPDGKRRYPLRSSRPIQPNNDYIFKNLFHGLRYLDFGEQLIQTRSIHDFKRVTHLFHEMKEIRGNSADESNMASVIEFSRAKSAELKSKLDELVPTNIITGEFEAHITFDSTDNIEETFEKLERTCKNTKYQIILNEWNTRRRQVVRQELKVSSFYSGVYPSIIQQIVQEAYKHFQDFNIIGIKIKSLASNEGVPQTNIERSLFWDVTTIHFEFQYKISLRRDRNGEKLKKLQDFCRSTYRYVFELSRNSTKRSDEKNFYYIITMPCFNLGGEEALQMNQEAHEYLTENGFQPLETLCEFIVHDINMEMEDN